MKKLILATAFSLLLAAPVIAGDTAPQPKGSASDIAQLKAEILKRIDARIASNQEEKTCIKAAKTQDDITACQEKFKAALREQHQKNQEKQPK